ncbi:MAG: ABC transporter permease [Candidatus Margulisbacteria bacterium]|nr:ABC transporter permease [Candidatus Margulisiibacteriota bacterium]
MDLARKVFKNKLARFGLWVLIILALAAIFAPFFAPYDPNRINLLAETTPPCFKHPFGTDDLGRDILSRSLFGARVSLVVGLIAMSISLSIGIIIGGIAGFFKGWIDNLLMRIVDVFLSLPTIFIILALQVIFKPSIFTVMAVIGVTSWMGTSRIVRAEFLKLSAQTFVTASKAYGYKSSKIIFKHILPNAFAPIGVIAVLGIAGAILTESTLSFFGLGIQPPHASWGSMLQNAQEYLFKAPWMAIIPGCLILITVLSLNFIGESIRENLAQ